MQDPFWRRQMQMNFSSFKYTIKKIPKLSITYKNIQIIQHSQISRLSPWITAPGNMWLWKVLKSTQDSNFYHMRTSIWLQLYADLRRILYPCLAYYPNLTQKLKNNILIFQNKYTCFCLHFNAIWHKLWRRILIRSRNKQSHIQRKKKLKGMEIQWSAIKKTKKNPIWSKRMKRSLEVFNMQLRVIEFDLAMSVWMRTNKK